MGLGELVDAFRLHVVFHELLGFAIGGDGDLWRFGIGCGGVWSMVGSWLSWVHGRVEGMRMFG